MAGIRRQIKVGSGPDALRDSGTFATRREADQWAARRRAELMAQRDGTEGRQKTLRDALRRYAEEVAPTHRGERWEQVRLAAFEDHEHLPTTLKIADVRPEHITRWRLWRESKVGPASVRREMSLLGSVFTAARRDWRWIAESPMADVKRPTLPASRDRVLSRSEIKAMLRELGYRWGRRPASIKAMAAYALLLALRTGMRAGEIVGMEWARVHGAWVELPLTKNGTARDVPLSRKARRLLECLRGLDDVRVLPMTVQTLDATFRRARSDAGLDGFVFHDTRHTAATWIGRSVGMPGRLSFPEFCRVFGWRDPRNAMIYVNPSAASLADKL